MSVGRSLLRGEDRALAFLRRGPVVRQPRGWRFGTARIPVVVLNRLLAAGKARRIGDRIELAS